MNETINCEALFEFANRNCLDQTVIVSQNKN
jgi:hypothetical protein